MHCLVSYGLELFKTFDHNVPNMYDVFQYDFIPNQIIIGKRFSSYVGYNEWIYSKFIYHHKVNACEIAM